MSPVLALHGTLVAMAPTREGLACAADSIGTVAGRPIVTNSKLCRAEEHGVLFTATGTTAVFRPPAQPLSGEEFVAYIREHEPTYAADRTVAEALRNLCPEEVTQSLVLDVAKIVVGEFRRLQESGDAPPVPDHQIILASYSEIATIGAVSIGPSGASDATIHRFQPGDRWQVLTFGEATWLAAMIRSAQLIQPTSITALLDSQAAISSVSRQDGLAAVKDLLDAAVETASRSPAKSGVGGAVQVEFLD